MALRGGPALEAPILRPLAALLLLAAVAVLPVALSIEPAPSLGDLSPTGRPTHVDVTDAVGLGDFLHAGYLGPGDAIGEPPVFLESMGPGACWIDADRDGWLDLYLVNGRYLSEPERNDVLHPHSQLYRNTGGTFVDVTDATGTRLDTLGQGCAAADYDNDGWTDLYVTGWNGNTLFHNVGGTFEDVTDAAGVRDAQCGDFACWGSSLSWIDVELDGDLDLYVDHFSDYDPADPPEVNGPGPGQVNRLFVNNGDGTFADGTVAADLGNERSDTWSSLAADFDADGWPDLYVCNDGDENDMYLNDGDGTFTRTPMAAVNLRSCMGSAIGDPDHDGDWDIAVTNFVGQLNGIFIDNGPDYDDIGGDEPFVDADPFSGWATHWYDINNDGHQDLVMLNSFTEDTGLIAMAEPVLAYENVDGALSFRSVRTELGEPIARDYVGRGGAWGDYDNDGDVDMLIAEGGEAGTNLLRADLTGGNFLNVDLVGQAPGVNRDAVGARVTVRANGLADQFTEKLAGSGYLGSNDPRLHFGLARAESADVEVRWPDGAVETWTDVRANSFVRLTQGDPAAETLRELPILRVAGPELGQRLSPLTFEAEALLSEAAGVDAIAWDFGGGRGAAEGSSASFAFDDVGAFTVRATVTDTLGHMKTQAMRVMIWDDLEAEIAWDSEVVLPTEKASGEVTVRFSNGDLVAGAEVLVNVTRSSGNAAVDEIVMQLPRFVRDLLGYNFTEISGTTGADGRLAFEVPFNLVSPTPAVEFEANHVGEYVVRVTGGARGSTFDDVHGAYVVVAKLPDAGER